MGRRVLSQLGLLLGSASAGLAVALASGLLKPQPISLPRVEISRPGGPSLNSPGSEVRLTGRATVIDGDTIELQRERVRLFGVDAPESRQVCQDSRGRDYGCGQRAAQALADRIGTATVSCAKKDTDRYDRIVAVCQVGTTDLGAWLVSEGHALAFNRYSTAYVADEETAKEGRRGMWVGRFAKPWEWRAGRS